MSCCKARLLSLMVATALLPIAAGDAARAQSGSRGFSPPPPQTGGSLLGDSGRQREVHGLSLSATDEIVREIRVEGNHTVPTQRILGQLETKVGRQYDPRALSRDVRKLASQRWFVNVIPDSDATPDGAGRVITLRVTERATIRYIEYLGNSKLKDKKLAKETDLKVGASLDPYAVEDGRQRLEALYTENGFPQARVSVLEGNKPDDKGIVYVINEGVKQKIWKVTFEGNDSDFATDRRLKTRIRSKTAKFIFFGGKLNREQLDADVRTLEAYYRDFGFFDTKVGRILEFNDAGTWATIRFVIDEGPRYQVRAVRFLGNERFATESLAAGMKLTENHLYERSKQVADVEWLKEVYGSYGYVFADVRPEIVYLEEPGKLDLVYHLDEGKKWRVGRIFVHIDGDNPHTRIQTALNRLSIRPGEVMDIRELRASERRLQASSLFLSEPARGVTPRITFQIPELGDAEFTASGGQRQVRGQSPDAGPRPHQAFKPAGDGSMYGAGADIHLVIGGYRAIGGDEAGHVYEVTETQSGGARRHTAFKPPTIDSVYSRGLDRRRPAPQRSTPATRAARPIIRGQNPGFPPPAQQQTFAPPPQNFAGQQAPQQPPQQAAWSSTPTAWPAAAPPTAAAQTGAAGFGGVTPRAVSPAAAPAGYGATAAYNQAAAAPGAVQQTQFEQFPNTPPPVGAPAPSVTGAPFTAPNIAPEVFPTPPSSQLFPRGGFGDPSLPPVDLHVQLQEAPTGRFQIGAGVNSDAGLIGQILIDERNFDWKQLPTSWQDVVDGTAFRGGGQRFRIEAAPGTQVQRYLFSWQDPYFRDTPISLGLSGSFFDRRFEDYDEQRLGGRVSTGYQWTQNDLSASLSYRYESVSIFDAAVVPSLAEAVGRDNQLHGFGLRIVNDTRNSPFFATDGYYAELQIEQVVGTFDYPRAILDARRYFLLRERPDHSGRHVLSATTRLGFTGSNTPIYDRFFAGGFSTLRGYDFRGAGPVEFDGISGRTVEVGGDFMWINTLEYQFPLTADDAINAVAFVDFGTVETSVKIEDFRVAPGVGLRLQIPALGPAPIALDFAFPIASADTDDEQIFTFNISAGR